MNRDLIAEKAGDFIRNSPEAKDFESHSLLQGVLVDFALTLASNTEIIGSVSQRSELLDFKEWWNNLPDESDDKLYMTNETIKRYLKSNCA